MKSKWLIIIGLVVPIILTDIYAGPVAEHEHVQKATAQQLPTELVEYIPPTGFEVAIDQMHQSNGPWRTWVVWGIDDLPDSHMAVGDAFRIQKVGEVIKLVPLNTLRQRWNKTDPGFSVPLPKTTGANPRYCGEVNIPSGHNSEASGHIITLKQSGAGTGPNNIIISFNEGTSCTSEKTHAGFAHAEN